MAENRRFMNFFTLINIYWSDQCDQIIILNWDQFSGLSRNGFWWCKVIQKSRFFNSHDPPRSWQIQIPDIFWILAFPVTFWPIISFLDNSAILLNSIHRPGFKEIRGAMVCYLAVPIYFCGKLSTGGFRLMWISLLQFFKTFQKYLAYAFLGLFISLLRFLYLANAILGLFISLLRFFGQK